jgi:hypothetical protein
MSSRLRSLNSSKISFFAFQDIITAVSGILILVTLILATALERPSQSRAQDADPEFARQLQDTLRQQMEADAQNSRLQELLAAAETAPALGKLESDVSRLRSQLSAERKKQTSLSDGMAASQSAIEARDRTLGLTDLKSQIQRNIQETESLVREETKVRDEMNRLDQRVSRGQSKILKLREREGKLWLIPDMSSTTKEPILAVISSSGAKLERFDHPDEANEFTKASALSGFGTYLSNAKPVDQYLVFLVRPSGIELFDSLVKLARDRGFEVGFDALEEDKDVYFTTPPMPDEPPPPLASTTSQYRPGSGGYSDPRGGAGEVTPAGSVPGNKTTNSINSGGGGGPPATNGPPPSTGQGKQKSSSQSASVSTATVKSLWQRFLEWIGIKQQ